MSRAAAIRTLALCAQAEMALVRRDPVAGPLLAQAARAAAGTGPAPLVSAAADLVRRPPDAPGAPAAARRKVTQALVRAARIRAEAVLSEPPGGS
jgi:hypothetical protein